MTSKGRLETFSEEKWEQSEHKTREGHGHEEDANKAIENVFFFPKGTTLCGGEIFKKEKCIYSYSPNQEVNDRSTGNERVKVKG